MEEYIIHEQNIIFGMANNILKAGIEVNAFDLSEKALNQAENLGMSIKQNSESVLEDIDALITIKLNLKYLKFYSIFLSYIIKIIVYDFITYRSSINRLYCSGKS